MDTNSGHTETLISPEIYKIESGPNFQHDFILSMITTHPEGPLYDRKRSFPLLRDFKGNNLANASDEVLDNIKEFIRDCLAMLNSARRRGHSAYIVYGINDHWEVATHELEIGNEKHSLKGALGSCTRKIEPDELIKFYQNAHVFERLLRTIVEKEDMGSRINGLIDPTSHDIDFEFGWLTINKEPAFVCYLMFHPVPTPRAFVVRDMKPNIPPWLKKMGLSPTVTCTRQGDRKRDVKDSEIDLLISWRDIPFLDKGEWVEYAKRLRCGLETKFARMFESLGAPSDPDFVGMQPIRISGSGFDTLEEAINNFIKDDHNSRMFILGDGGVGKTTGIISELMKRTERLLHNIDDRNRSTDSQTKADFPTIEIPVYVPLGEFNSHIQTLESYVASCMQGIEPSKLHELKILQDTDLKFLIVFDAIDENTRSGRKITVDHLLRFAGNHPNAKFLFVSRPNIFAETTVETSLSVTIKKWTLTDQIAGIKAYALNHKIVDRSIQLLRGDAELSNLLSVPRMFDACMQGMKKKDFVSLGVIVESSVETFVEREQKKFDISIARQFRFRRNLEEYAIRCFPGIRTNRDHALEVFQDDELDSLLESGLLKHIDSDIAFVCAYVPQLLITHLLLRNSTRVNNIAQLIDTEPDNYSEIIRLAADLTAEDITKPSKRIGKWISGLTNPSLKAQIFLDRQNPQISNIEYWSETLSQLSNCDLEPELLKVIISEALQDSAFSIFAATLDAVKQHQQFIQLFDESDLQSLLSRQEDATRGAALWGLMVEVYRSDITKTFNYLFALRNQYPEMKDLLVFLIAHFDWSDGVPKNVIEQGVLGDAIPSEIKTAVLDCIVAHKLQADSEIRQILLPLATDSDPTVARLARHIRGDALLVDESPSIEETTDVTFISQSFLSQFGKSDNLEEYHES